MCGRLHRFIFEEVDQLTKARIVSTVGRSLDERRPLGQTFTAESLGQSAEEPFAAQEAAFAGNGLDRIQTLRADRQMGTGGERESAEAAIGGE